METSLIRKIIPFAFFAVCVFAPLILISVLSYLGMDTVDSCIYGLFAMMIFGAIALFLWSRLLDGFGFGMCIIVFALQCIVLYFTMEPLGNSVWVIVATQAGAVLGSGIIPVFFGIIEIDLDF